MKGAKKYTAMAAAAAAMLWLALATKGRKDHAQPPQWEPPKGMSGVGMKREAGQAASPLAAGELVSFALSNINPKTGLPPTAFAKAGSELKHPKASYTYVDAVVHQALLMAGRNGEAERIAENFRQRAEKMDLPDSLNSATGAADESGVSVGPNMYWGLSFLRQYQATGDKKWLGAAAARADFAISQQEADGGIRKRTDQSNSEYWVKSTEENLGACALFGWLYEETGAKLYLVARRRVLQWLAASGVYDRKRRCFLIGTFKDKVTPVYSVDVNALAMMVLGPNILDSGEEGVRFGGSGTAESLIESFSRAKTNVGYSRPGGGRIDGVTGFDFTDPNGRPQRQPIVSPEFTAQAVTAYLVLAAHEKESSRARAGKLLAEAKHYLDELGRIAARTEAGASLPYATQGGIRRFVFDEFQTPETDADLSSLWAAYPLAGFNPFARDGFALKDGLKGMAPWLASIGPVAVEPSRSAVNEMAVGPPEPKSSLKLKAYSEAPRMEGMDAPLKYYEVFYEQVKKDSVLASRRAVAGLMTSHSALVDGLAPKKNIGVVVGIGRGNVVTQRRLDEMEPLISNVLREDYIYRDADSGTTWRLFPKYNLNADYKKGIYYAFEIDPEFNIVRRFASLSDVPPQNRAGLQNMKSQFQSTADLPEGHLIARYFSALEVDDDMRIVKAYENLNSLPGIVSRVPITKTDYERYIVAEGKDRRKFLAAGVLPNARGLLAEKEDGKYYANIVALDDMRRRRVRGVSAEGRQLVLGTRASLGNWTLSEALKLNSIKYEEGLINGMIVRPRPASPNEKLLPTDPLWVVLGDDAIASAKERLKARLLEMLIKIKSANDRQFVNEYIKQYDELMNAMEFVDDNGALTVIYHGARAAERRFADMDKARVIFEDSLIIYESILGKDERGRDLRDPQGRVWMKTIDKLTRKILTVEIYDIGGNLETIYSGNPSVDPASKKITALVKTDLIYDPKTYQLIGKHSYKVDRAGNFVQDVSEGIFRGYTPDRKHYIMEKQIFLKNANGQLALDPAGRPLYRSRMEYYSIQDGEKAAEIYGNVLRVRFGQYPNMTEEMFLIPPDHAKDYPRENLEDAIKGRIWVRKIKPPVRIKTFREVLIESLTAVPEHSRFNVAAEIMLRLAKENFQPGEKLLLGENEFINDGTKNGDAPGGESTLYFYDPADNLWRPRIVVKKDSIQVPIEWLEESQTPLKTMTFNLAGELISVGKVEKLVRADSVIPPRYLGKMAILGVEPDTLLPKLSKKTFRIVSGQDGRPHFSDAVSVESVYYLLPDDILGRDLMSIRYTMEGNGIIRSLRTAGGTMVNMSGLGRLLGRQERPVAAKKEEIVIDEWYKQWLDKDGLKAALLEDIFQNAVRSGVMKRGEVPKTYEQLQRGLLTGKIKPGHLPVPIDEIKSALEEVRAPPLGISPGAHVLRPDKRLVGIRYFSGVVEHPRGEFGYPGIKIDAARNLEPFELPGGPPLKGISYGEMSAPFLFHWTYSVDGQLQVREQPFVIMQLMNLYPIFAGKQTEYYDPLSPQYLPKPIKTERVLTPGDKPQVISVLLQDSLRYDSDGWQTVTSVERNPYDPERWSSSDLHFDETGVCRFHVERFERFSASAESGRLWQAPAAAAAAAVALLFGLGRLCHRKLLDARLARMLRAEKELETGIKAAGSAKPFSLAELDKAKAAVKACGVPEQLLEALHAECAKTASPHFDPESLYRAVTAVYAPLIESRLRLINADPSQYTAAVKHLVARIAARIGRESIDLNGLYALEIQAFNEWSLKLGHHFEFKDGRIVRDGNPVPSPTSLAEDDLFLLALYRLIFEESKEFKAAVPELRYYLFDKSLALLCREQDNIMIASPRDIVLQEICGDVWAVMEALRPGYDRKPPLSKADRLTFEDVIDLFRGRKKYFLSNFSGLVGQPKEVKLSFLAGEGAGVKDPKSYLWLKTDDDRVGLLKFIGNLRPLWLVLAPLFITTVLGAVTMGTNALPFSFLAQYLLTVTAGLVLTYLLSKRVIPWTGFPNGTESEYHTKARQSLRSFWLLFALTAYAWGAVCVTIVAASVEAIAKLTIVSLGWNIAIRGGIMMITGSFILASYASMVHIMMAIFSYLQAKREGCGQIVSWQQLRKNFDAARERFARIMRSGPAAASEGSSEDHWPFYWNAVVGELYEDSQISKAEAGALMYAKGKLPDLGRELEDGEANFRLRYFVNSWLMDVPKAEAWLELPTLTVLISAYNEPVSYSFSDINSAERGATATRLNHLVANYRKNWQRMVAGLTREELGGVVTREELAELRGLRRLPSGIPDPLKQKITRWANTTVQCLEKTLRDMAKIRTAFMMYAQSCYPQASPEELSCMVSAKLQILLSCEAYHHDAVPDSHRVALRRLMKDLPYLDVYWNSAPKDHVSGEGIERVEYVKGTDAGLHRHDCQTGRVELAELCPETAPIKRGKPTGLNQALPFVRGETILFFDANTAVRLDDALKLPLALSEFRSDPYLGEVLMMEYTFNRRFSWIIDALSFSEETFTSATQRALNMFQACGFYGHSAIVRTDAVTLSGGIPQDYVSEDILLAAALWEKGFGTTHKEYLMLGKGRETSYFSSLVPLTKWAMGAAEISIGRKAQEILGSERLHAAQKFMLFFGFSFYYITPLMLFINFMYLWFMLCWGINGFAAVPYPLLAGLVGLCLNQATMASGVVNLLTRVGVRRTALIYLRLFGKNLFYFASVIPAYAYGFAAGLYGKAIFIVSSKGWNLGHVPLVSIWGKRRAVLLTAILTSVIGIPVLFTLMAMGLLSYVVCPFIPFIPYAVISFMYVFGLLGERFRVESLASWKEEIEEHDDNRMALIKLQLMYAMGLVVFSVLGVLMWGIGFSSLQVKGMFLVSLLYITCGLSCVIMPLVQHAQPAVLLKEMTSSRIWNFIIVPLCAVSTSMCIGSIFPYMGSSDFVYCFATIYICWILLKRHLNDYEVLHEWLKNHFDRSSDLPYSAWSEAMDTMYFGHQALIELGKSKKQSDSGVNPLVRGVVAGTLVCAIGLYALHQIRYPWLLQMLLLVYFNREALLPRPEGLMFKNLIQNLESDDMGSL